MAELDTAISDFRRLVQVAFGNIAWPSILIISFGLIQAVRLSPRVQDYAILLVGGIASLVTGTYLYVVNVHRIDEPNLRSRTSLIGGFFIGGSETVIFFFGLYLLLIRGFYGLYTLTSHFGLLRLISGLGFILLALIILNGVRKLRRVTEFQDRLDSTFAAREAREDLAD